MYLVVFSLGLADQIPPVPGQVLVEFFSPASGLRKALRIGYGS